MKISKKDALSWFTFFAALPEDEEIQQHQQEIIYAVFSQIEDAVDARNERLPDADDFAPTVLALHRHQRSGGPRFDRYGCAAGYGPPAPDSRHP